LPRETGVEFFYLQFQGHQVFFTPLIEFQTHGENATPRLILTHYTDLLKYDKGIVLMRGEFSQGHFLKMLDGQSLVYQLQEYYVTGPLQKLSLLEQFHKEPAAFNYQTLIDQIGT